MKKIILFTSLILSMTFTAEARPLTERIQYAVEILSSVTEDSGTFKVKPNKDPKQMLLELALEKGEVESVEDFEHRWVGHDGSAWDADSLHWGLTNLSGAEDYVTTVLEQRLEEGLEYDEANPKKLKMEFAENMMKKKRAFELLGTIKSVKFGVAPMGAVQCGVTFSSLLIIDTESGEMHQIVMEGSGC